MNEMLGRVGVNFGGLVGRKVRTHVSWLGQYFTIYKCNVGKCGNLGGWVELHLFIHPS